MKIKNSISSGLLMSVIIVLLSCQRLFEGLDPVSVPVDIPVEDVPVILIINGEIEKDSTCWVDIEYSLDIDTDVSRNFEREATVILSTNDGRSENLSLKDDATGRYVGATILGKVGVTYTLNVIINGKTYRATSTMSPEPGYDTAWVHTSKGSKAGFGYSDEWKVLDPPETRDRYLFEWWTNGEHIVLRDWAIDDNRVVNTGGCLRLFTVTMNPGSNEHIRHRAAKIDILTYEYYNMYEKIVRGLVGVSSQTPYNPVSNFGKGTIGNFRALAFSEYIVLTPPNISVRGENGQVVLHYFPNEAGFFKKYNLYWSTVPGITEQSNVITDIESLFAEELNRQICTQNKLTNGTSYYYRISVEDSIGTVSVLSPEVSATPIDSLFPPYYVNAKKSNATSSEIFWSSVPGAKHYTIFWSEKDSVTDSSELLAANVTDTHYIHAGLVNKKIYYYRIRASDSNGIYSELSYTANTSGIIQK